MLSTREYRMDESTIDANRTGQCELLIGKRTAFDRFHFLLYLFKFKCIANGHRIERSIEYYHNLLSLFPILRRITGFICNYRKMIGFDSALLRLYLNSDACNIQRNVF